jgi:hypothetical protein
MSFYKKKNYQGIVRIFIFIEAKKYDYGLGRSQGLMLYFWVERWSGGWA